MNAAHLAEGVLRGAGVKLIGREIVLAADQLELLRRHDQMQEPLLAADRAIAIGDAVEIGGDAETHPAAMTAAFVGLCHGRVVACRAVQCHAVGAPMIDTCTISGGTPKRTGKMLNPSPPETIRSHCSRTWP